MRFKGFVTTKPSVQKTLEGVCRSREKVKHAEKVQEQTGTCGTLNQSNRATEKQ